MSGGFRSGRNDGWALVILLRLKERYMVWDGIVLDELLIPNPRDISHRRSTSESKK